MAAVSVGNRTDENLTSNALETSFSRSIRFWILLPCGILSINCCLLLLYYFVRVRKLRRALNNHVLIIAILLELLYLLIDIPLYLNFLRLASAWPAVPSTCLMWWLSNNALQETVTIFVAWAAMERHILIFHHQWLLTRKKRIFVHYLPIASILLYAALFYGTTIFFPACQHLYRYTEEWCESPCLFKNSIFLLYQLVVNKTLFTLLIVVGSFTLLVRVIWHKRTYLHQPIQWRKHRRMTIQLLAVASPYVFFQLPQMIIEVFQPFDLTSSFGAIFVMYMNFVSYLPELLLPLTSLAALHPKPWNRRRRLVGVAT